LLTEKYIIPNETSYFPPSIDGIPLPEHELQLVLGLRWAVIARGASFEDMLGEEIVGDEVGGFEQHVHVRWRGAFERG
jgi:hypothetical protein